MDKIIGEEEASAVVRTERLLSSDCATVFSAFEQPDLLAQWWGPKGFTNTFAVFEFTQGGRWSFTMHGPNGAGYANECLFAEIQPPTRIVIDHIVNPRFRLTVTLEARGGGTRIGWAQEFESPELAGKLRPFCGPANEEVLDRLEALLGGPVRKVCGGAAIVSRSPPDEDRRRGELHSERESQKRQ